MNGCLIALLLISLIGIVIYLSTEAFPIIVFLFFLFILWKTYEFIYYKSKKFLSIKNSIDLYVKNCNELNEHIEELKNTHLGIDQLDYGHSDYYDDSKYHYKRSELKNQKYSPNVCNCSRNVCNNARQHPFKYICKYFNIETDEATLSNFESILNNFEAAESGKIALKNEKEKLLNSIANEIPFLINKFSKKKLQKKLGFTEIDFKTVYFPKYIFKYVSSGGNASLQCDIVMDIDNLNRFVKYLVDNIKFKKSVAGQRALMTSELRKKILQRDNFTCKNCGASIHEEPNLLLEIDHIIPVSKGGLTSEDNLQTLCWKCNRKKGAKITENV